jgi:hypothetical protein
MTETRTVISVIPVGVIAVFPGAALGRSQYGRRVRCRFDPHRTTLVSRHAKGRKAGAGYCPWRRYGAVVRLTKRCAGPAQSSPRAKTVR